MLKPLTQQERDEPRNTRNTRRAQLRLHSPAKAKWDGWGFEYKSETKFLRLPVLHISFKYRPNRIPVPARGFIPIGLLACGFVTSSQFGIGLVSISQFTVAAYALAQFAFAYSLIAQLGIHVHEGHGQVVKSLSALIGTL